MANQAEKKLAQSNQQTLRLLRQIFLAVHAAFLILNWLFAGGVSGGWYQNSLGSWIYWIGTVGGALILLQLHSMGQPSFSKDGGQLLSGGSVDLSGPGLQQYLFDLLYLTWFATVGGLFTEYAAYIYLLVPLYAARLAWKWLAKPFIDNLYRQSMLASRNGGSGSDGGAGNLSKRQQKLQSKKQQQVKYIR